MANCCEVPKYGYADVTSPVGDEPSAECLRGTVGKMRLEILSNGFTRLAALMLAAGLGLGCTTVQSTPIIDHEVRPRYFGPTETNTVVGDSPGFAPMHSPPMESVELDIPSTQQRWVF